MPEQFSKQELSSQNFDSVEKKPNNDFENFYPKFNSETSLNLLSNRKNSILNEFHTGRESINDESDYVLKNNFCSSKNNKINTSVNTINIFNNSNEVNNFESNYFSSISNPNSSKKINYGNNIMNYTPNNDQFGYNYISYNSCKLVNNLNNSNMKKAIISEPNMMYNNPCWLNNAKYDSNKNINYLKKNKNTKKNYEYNFFEPKNNSNSSNNIDIKNPKKEIEDFVKYVFSLSMPLKDILCSQKGINEVQKFINKSNIDLIFILLNILNKEGLIKIMKNTYGNYFVQQLILNSNPKIIHCILEYIYDSFVDISKNESGIFALQKLIDEIPTPSDDEILVLKAIEKHEIEMIYHKYGTYVLQKIVSHIPDNRRIALNEIITNNIKDLALDVNGICLLKKFISSNTIEGDKKIVKDVFKNNILILSQSPYGNYGIQFLLENWKWDDLKEIIEKICENINILSSQQYSFNVIEKLIDISDEISREKIFLKLCFDGNIANLLKNRYSRNVIYKSITYMNENLCKKLEVFLDNCLKSSIYSRKEKNLIKKLLSKIKTKK